MTDERDPAGEPTLFPVSVGERLRDARLAQQLELADVAQRTRIPLRHLAAIESGDYSQMPTPTYAVGFARAYARAVGEDEVEVAREVRGLTDQQPRRVAEYQAYDTDEPVKTPSRGVMFGAIAAAVLILVAVGLWYGTTLFRGDGLPSAEPSAVPSFVPEAPPEVTPEATPSSPAAVAGGQVTLVANDQVWLRVYDNTGKTLIEKTLQPGERYDVPADAAGPMINVGRPDKLQVLVNGSAVPPLGSGKVAIKDVGISAAALTARGTVSPTPTPSASPSAAAAGTAPRLSASRSVPAAFRSPTPLPTRTTAAPISTGQRDTAPSPLAAPGNQLQ